MQVPPASRSGACQHPQSASSRGSEYAMLSRHVQQAGLLDRRLRYYAWKITLTALGLFGFYLGCSFAPNHKGMPVLAAPEKTDFLRRQVLTSRNVRGGWLTDFAMGGLNYQIEHHLFPSMPRPGLRRSQALVAAFCAERDLPYCQTTLLGSYAQALRYLNTIGKLTRPGAVIAIAPALTPP